MEELMGDDASQVRVFVKQLRDGPGLIERVVWEKYATVGNCDTQANTLLLIILELVADIVPSGLRDPNIFCCQARTVFIDRSDR